MNITSKNFSSALKSVKNSNETLSALASFALEQVIAHNNTDYMSKVFAALTLQNPQNLNANGQKLKSYLADNAKFLSIKKLNTPVVLSGNVTSFFTVKVKKGQDPILPVQTFIEWLNADKEAKEPKSALEKVTAALNTINKQTANIDNAGELIEIALTMQKLAQLLISEAEDLAPSDTQAPFSLTSTLEGDKVVIAH
jgi:hypothetical protein